MANDQPHNMAALAPRTDDVRGRARGGAAPALPVCIRSWKIPHVARNAAQLAASLDRTLLAARSGPDARGQLHVWAVHGLIHDHEALKMTLEGASRCAPRFNAYDGGCPALTLSPHQLSLAADQARAFDPAGLDHSHPCSIAPV